MGGEKIKEEIKEFRTKKGSLPILNYLGKEITLNLCDGQVLFTPGRTPLAWLARDMERDPMDTMVFGFLLSALNLPTYFTIEVTDPKKTEELIPQTIRELYSDKYIPYSQKVEIYAIDNLGTTTIYTLSVTFFEIKFRSYLAVIGDRLVIASRRDILTDLLAGKARPTVRNSGNFELSVYRDAFRELEPIVNLGHQEDLRHACHDNLSLTSILLKELGTKPEHLKEKTAALRGYEPYCPSGGKYVVDPTTDQASCALHGNSLHPRQPAAGDEESSAYRLVNSLERINARLSFTPEGLMTEVEIRRKHQGFLRWVKSLF